MGHHVSVLVGVCNYCAEHTCDAGRGSAARGVRYARSRIGRFVSCGFSA